MLAMIVVKGPLVSTPDSLKFLVANSSFNVILTIRGLETGLIDVDVLGFAVVEWLLGLSSDRGYQLIRF